MSGLHEVHLAPLPIARFASILGEAEVELAERRAAAMRARGGCCIWNVSSTAIGGGVAEMLRTLLPYARGAGIDVRWLVIDGTPEFFRVTKRVHNALHGEPGDFSALGCAARAVYEANLRINVEQILSLVASRDTVLLHDPQTAGLAPHLRRRGARVIWRCHIGRDEPNEQTALGWSFLEPYLASADALVFTRAAYVPEHLRDRKIAIITPSIDPFSAKNQELDATTVRAILTHVGLVAGALDGGRPVFRRFDGSPGRVDRAADVIGLGPPVPWDAPLVVQVSRWDALKDPVGVLGGFARLAARGEHPEAHLMLAGPTVHAVADDPDAARVFGEVLAAWRELPRGVRQLVHLAHLPAQDVEENAAVVNALQRHASIVVQKSLREGFGLTVTEAMWKARPVVASAVGGIRDQIVDAEHGLLVGPTDSAAFADALRRLLDDPAWAATLGAHARERVRERFLGLRHLLEYVELFESVEAEAGAHAAAGI